MPFPVRFKVHLPLPQVVIFVPQKGMPMMASGSVPFSSSPAHPLPPPQAQSPVQTHPLISLLEGCKTMHDFKQVHAQMIRGGFIRGLAEQRRMISFCCARDTGDMRYARRLFDEIREPGVFLWNTMIRGYSNRDSPDSAILMYSEMLQRGFTPDDHTFPFLLKSFTCDTATHFGKELHSHVLKFGLASNAFVQNALIHMYCLYGQVGAARGIFDKSLKQDVIIWNAMISGYNKNMKFEESCKLFQDMKKENVKPTWVTLLSVLSSCTKLKDLHFGRLVHHEIEEAQLVPNLTLENALVSMYAECGDMDVAFMLFDNMKVRDVISWTAVVKGFANMGQIKQARALFEQMPQRDLVSWTAMIDGYVKMNHFKEALEIFREMQMSDVQPDEFSIVSILTACAHLGTLEVGEWVRLYIDRSKIKADVFVANTLIDMYSKCGAVDKAVEIFRKMHQKDKFTWTAMITGLAVNGHGEEALDLFFEMLRASVKPDSVTYIGVLLACVHSGLVDRGRQLFSSMISTHGIMPDVAHYGCIVDLLGRAGHLQEALETINNMPMRPNSIVWGSLLGASRVHKNLEMAEIAVKHILELEPHNSAAYVLLSNIYAKCNRWEEVRRVRKEILDKGIKKTPGCSVIEMDGVIHEFVAGDTSHPKSTEIYSKLEDMGEELKLSGYTPDTSEVFLDIAEEEKENAIYRHSEKLAVAFGLISSASGATIRIVKNLRMCLDCHSAMKFASDVYEREIIVRDRTRFHRFQGGSCSCRDYW